LIKLYYSVTNQTYAALIPTLQGILFKYDFCDVSYFIVYQEITRNKSLDSTSA